MPQLNDNETQLYTHLVKEIHLHKFSLQFFQPLVVAR